MKRPIGLSVAALVVGGCLFAGCSQAASLEEVEIFDQQLEARVEALRELGVEAWVFGHARIDKLFSVCHGVDGPLDADIFVAVKIEPPRKEPEP